MITSFGIIPFRNVKGKWQVLLVQHVNGQHWGFPKGKVEEMESARDAAARELREETGLTVQQYISEEPFTEHYNLSGKKKSVGYYPALVTGVLKCQLDEILSANWFSLDDAAKQLSFLESQRIFTQARKILYGTIT